MLYASSKFALLICLNFLINGEQCRPMIRHRYLRRSRRLIWVYTVCSDLSVPISRESTVSLNLLNLNISILDNVYYILLPYFIFHKNLQIDIPCNGSLK